MPGSEAGISSGLVVRNGIAPALWALHGLRCLEVVGGYFDNFEGVEKLPALRLAKLSDTSAESISFAAPIEQPTIVGAKRLKTLPEVSDPRKLTLLELSELTSVSLAGIGTFENLR